jgi:WD40 repeat protein
LNRVDVLQSAADADTVSAFLYALRERGIEIEPASDRPSASCPLVVLITPSMLEGREPQNVLALARGYDEVLPVSFLPGPSPLFAELSQSLIGQLGVDECAARISTIAKYGGKTIVGWNALVAAADRWRDEGARGLLPESEVTEALSLLQSGPALESRHRELVSEFIEASQQSLRRRRRRGMTIVGATALVLTIVLVLAVVQAVSARLSQIRAERAANVATADRLARTATDLIPGNPDLPTLLALTAIEAAPTDATDEATSRVAASTWPHESFTVGYRAGGLSAAAESPRIAVLNAGQGTAVVYDRAGGDPLGEFAFGEGGSADNGIAKLSPDGRLLAIQSADSYGVTVFDIAQGAEMSGTQDLEQGNVTLLGWLDNGRLLVGRGNRVLSVSLTDDSVDLIVEAKPGETVDSASVHNDLNRIVVATDASVLVVNSSTGHVEHSRPVRIGGPALSSDGETVLGIDFPTLVTYEIDDDSVEPPRPTNVHARQVLPLAGTFSLLASSDGEISIYSSGRVFQTVRAHLSGRVWAARLNDDRFATVGADGFLRVWSVPPVSTFGVPTALGLVDESTRMASAIGVHVAPRESARNQIRRAAGKYLVVTTVPGYAHVLTAEGLKPFDRWFFSGLQTDVSLSANGSQISTVSLDSARSYAFDESKEFWSYAQKSELPGSQVETAIGHGGKAVSAVSDDGATFIIADDYVVSRRREGDNSDSSFDVARRPVSLSPDNSGPGRVLTDDGYLRSPDGAEQRLPTDAGDGSADIAIAAAEPDGADGFTIVTDDGRLLAATPTQVTPIGEIGSGGRPFAVRMSADRSRVAVIGEQGVLVFDISAGRVVFRESTPGEAMITDVVFSDDSATLYAVNEIGAVRSLDVSRQSDQNPQLVAPRGLTPEEATLFNVEVG